jgi:hypothetical protein
VGFERIFIAMHSMNADENCGSETQYTAEDMNLVIFDQKISKEDSNALLVQTLLKQNELLIGMLRGVHPTLLE